MMNMERVNFEGEVYDPRQLWNFVMKLNVVLIKMWEFTFIYVFVKTHWLSKINL